MNLLVFFSTLVYLVLAAAIYYLMDYTNNIVDPLWGVIAVLTMGFIRTQYNYFGLIELAVNDPKELNDLINKAKNGEIE